MPDPILRIAGDDEKSLPRRINFTVAALAAAKCPAGKERVVMYDARTPGLAFRVTSNGAKSFIVYKKVHGRPLRMKLGGFPAITIDQARQLAAGVNAQLAQGLDPMEERRAVRASITLQELFDRYTKEHAELRSTERTRTTDKSRFDTCFEDWTSWKLATIRQSHVREKHAELARTRGKTTANRAVQLLRRMFNWARVTPNPAARGVVDFFKETERDRFADGEELQRLFAALDAETNETIRDYIKVSLWTGARRGNVQSMRWDELNLTTATWTVPTHKSKSREAMKIHLSAPALAVLKARRGNGSDFVFPGPGKHGHLVEPKLAWRRVLKAAGITDLHLHDLRRTLGSWQAATGASLPVIGKSLGHHDVGTTAIYARLNLDPVRASVDAAAAAIQAAIAPRKQRKPAKRKLPLRGRRRAKGK